MVFCVLHFINVEIGKGGVVVFAEVFEEKLDACGWVLSRLPFRQANHGDVIEECHFQ